VIVATPIFVGLAADDAGGSNPDKRSALLGLVQDEPALRAGAASGILDKPCARRSAGGRSAPRNGPLDLTKEYAIWIWDPDGRHSKPR
jgi:hypothetical protein